MSFILDRSALVHVKVSDTKWGKDDKVIICRFGTL